MRENYGGLRCYIGILWISSVFDPNLYAIMVPPYNTSRKINKKKEQDGERKEEVGE